MKSKLGIDFDKVGHAREMARKIADQVQDFVDGYTTVAVERTLCRLLGIDGVDVHAVPLPNILVDELKEKNVLGEGILFFLGNVMVETGMTPQEIAEQVAAGKVDVTRVPVCTPGQREKALQPYIEASIRRISDNRKRRENYIIDQIGSQNSMCFFDSVGSSQVVIFACVDNHSGKAVDHPRHKLVDQRPLHIDIPE